MSTTDTGLHVAALSRYALIREWLRADVARGGKVCEFGAAPGDQIVAIASDDYATTAVDIGIASDEWADGSSGRMLGLFKEHGVALVEWNLEETPYPLPDGEFDAVLLTEVFEHLRDYPIRSLHEAHRVLKPGGFLYFTTPNAAYLRNRWTLLRGGNPASPLRDWIGGLPHARHAREYTFAEIDEVMALAGFEVVRRVGRHFHLEGGGAAKRAVKQVLARIAEARPTLGPQIVITARAVAR